MIVYRCSGEGLLRLAIMAASSPSADVDTILGVIRGADIEEAEPAPAPAPAIPAAAPVPAADPAPAAEVGTKLAKPEEA